VIRTQTSYIVSFAAALLVLSATTPVAGQVADVNEQTSLGNKPERVEWFGRLGFGLFVHWSVDSQLGSVISHSLVGADEEYCRRYFEELPKTFNPKRFDPDDWADLAKLAGTRYVVFTAKHHSGFCMFDTATTHFDIMNTPYRRDVLAELVPALRKRGIAVGLYFSPDDFWFLWRQGITIARRRPGVTPQENPRLMKHAKAQIFELLSNYGPIDIMFIDGPAEGLRELCWELQPNVVVTRGAMKTPEQYVPGVTVREPWEANMTMGTQWQFKPTNESYKSGGELIERLIETRAKGGNFLLNIGPEPDGTVPFEQDRRLREIGLWTFINREAIEDVEPWVVTNEENVWFTKRRGKNVVYAIITRPEWPYGERREITLRSVAMAGPDGKVGVLGQSGKVLEYQPNADPSTTWRQTDEGLVVSAMRAQRIYNDRKWPNPVVLKIEGATPVEVPARVTTGKAEVVPGRVTLHGELSFRGDKEVEVGFQLRRRHDPTQPLATADPWQTVALQKMLGKGEFVVQVSKPEAGAYEYRAMLKHPKVTLYGDVEQFTVR
jgi:alpha-L-fucosidase